LLTLENKLREEAAYEVSILSHADEATTATTDEGKRKRKKPVLDKIQLKYVMSFLRLVLFPHLSLPSRDRNRGHAKNTRLRKKIFIEKVQQLCENFTLERNRERQNRLLLGIRISQMVRVTDVSPLVD
jgi:hypothetical protein